MTSTRVNRAVLWSAADIFFNYGLNFVVIIVLSRILTPHDFGLLAILAIFISICSVLVDGGFGRALIQRQDITHIDESSVFYFNLFMGFVLACGLSLSASTFAVFYEEPILEYIVYALAINLFIGAFSSIHKSLLSKHLDFKVIAIVGAVSSTISAIVAIASALQGMGVWSLVLKTLTATVLSVILLWIFNSWRPTSRPRLSSLRSLASFGGFMVLSELLYRVYNNLYTAMVGKVYTAQEAGFLNQAQKLQQLPVSVITAVSSRVSFSVFSAASSEATRLIAGMRTALEMTIFASVPVTLTMVLEADAIIRLVFGDQWAASVPLLRIIGIAAFLIPVQMLNNTLLLSLGKAEIHFRLMVLKSIVGILLLIILSGKGLAAVAWAFTLSKIINLVINTHFTAKFIGYTLPNQILHIMPYVACSLPLALMLVARQFLYDSQDYVSLFIALASGGGIYVALCWLLKLQAINRLWEIIKLAPAR